ncbi:hypothetical protein [Streptomyces sp. NPDC096012]|uniref:hypothetical protein n=1 Tax=Streptomyces sp. NPDC096012 TaxID=3155684 RepID=UPI003369D63F
MAEVPDAETVCRAECGRAVAVLVRLLGDIDLTEEARQRQDPCRGHPRPSATGTPFGPTGWAPS